jgi:hypothetical protein
VIEGLDQLRGDLDGIGRRLKRVSAQHLNSRDDKEAVKAVVGRYFSQHRRRIVKAVKSEGELTSLDGSMQDLLRCAQRRALVSEYRELVKACQSTLDELETKSLRSSESEVPHSGLEPREHRILETLRKVNPSAALSYEQALTDLSDHNRKSFRGTVVEFREALRETLDALAPDDEVKNDPRFQAESGARGPTMKQKTAFILRTRRLTKSQAKTAEDALGLVEETVGRFVRSVYDRASTGVHTETASLEARRVKEYVTVVLGELLEIGE